MKARSRSNGHRVFLPAATAHRAESLATQRGRALLGIAEVVLPRLAGKEYAELLMHVLALSEQDYDAMGKLAVELDRWVIERYPRVAALKRPADLSDIAMAIDADRDSFNVELGMLNGELGEAVDTGLGKATEGTENAEEGACGAERSTSNVQRPTSNGSHGAPTFALAVLGMMLGGALR